MGLLDFLKSRPKKPEYTSLVEARSWISSQLEALKEDKRKKLGLAFQELPHRLDNLLREIDVLDKTQAGDVDARLKKVVSTNKPAYLEAMRRHIKTLRQPHNKDVFSHKKVFDETLGLVGEVNFGDGRYLGFVYEKQIRKIHNQCKGLVALKQETDVIVAETPQEKRLLELKEDADKLQERIESKKSLSKKLADLAQEHKKSGENIRSFEQELVSVQEALKKPEISECEKALSEARGKTDEIRLKACNLVAELKRPLRKYANNNPTESRFIEDLLSDPFKQFLEADAQKLREFIEGFEKSVAKGDTKIKKPKKKLEAIGEFKVFYTPKKRKKYLDLTQKQQQSAVRLKEFNALEEREILKQEIEKQIQRRQKLGEEINKTREKIGACKKRGEDDLKQLNNKLVQYNKKLVLG